MKKQEIINDIEAISDYDFSIWRIGLSHNPSDRKQEHKDEGQNTKHWKQWKADSLPDAEDIESYFINEKGMKGGTGGNLSSNKPIYIYIF